jgi:signal transduction histidine kinase
VGSHVIRTDPDAAQQSLDVIADTSRRALEQTRSMLGMLRDESDDSARPPTQGLDDLPALVDDVVAAGLRVEFVQPEPVPSLDAAVSLTAYRIVQESLTNVIKHSAAKTATVRVIVTDGSIDLEVSDLGPRRMDAASLVSGHGLVGLDERARLVGGSVEYGAVGDGFRVHATLPVGAFR